MIHLVSSVLSEIEKDFECKTGLPLLDQLEDAGVPLPYGCRAGSCGSCRIEIAEGRDLLEDIGPMERDTLDRCGDGTKVRLACRAKFKSAQSSGTLKIIKAKDL